MKKFLYSLAVMTLTFFAASCQQENLEPMEGGDAVTYTLQVPDAITTKTVGDGYTVYYEVYRELDIDDPDKDPIYSGSKAFEAGSNILELQLQFVKNQNFNVLFWAQKTQVSTADDTAYDISDLRYVTLNSLSANDADAEVFVGTDIVVKSVSSKNGHVQLIRPIAQLNIATLKSGLTLGAGTTVNPQDISIEIYGLYTSFNVATGDVSAPEKCIFQKALAANSSLNDKYTLLSRNFIGFIPEDGDNVDIDFTIYTENDGNISHSVSNVPVKPNYKTNIIGNLISASSDYSVSVVDQWGADCDDMEVITDGLVKNIEGDYEITNENGLAYAINNLWAYGGTFYLTKSLYEMARYAITPPDVSGSLNIYGEIPVVTRAASGGVTITGLVNALVAEVSASSSAVFSNITIDGNTDFVANNKGTIGFNECANNEGNAIQQLVGENTGNIVDLQDEILSLEQLQAVINTGVKQIVLSKPLINANGSDVTLDLKGAAISIVDATENNFEMIKNQGTLVIMNSASETAVMTVRSTTDTGTSRYSAVIANTVGGNLTVQDDIMIEHLGGTYMAYGIDNLTNGKGTYAVVTLDGATVKSPYRAVRQFLNGVEATNELYVKSGSKLYGENKSIFFHDPSTNANTGKLVVEEGAELHGDVYLFVAAGSTEWPVSVSISASTLKDGSEVLTANLPDGYIVDEQEGAYVVNYKSPSQSSLEALINNGGQVALNEDVQLSSELRIPDGTDLVLDLNGKTITAGNDGYAICNYGANLQIIDSQNCGSVTGIVYTGNAVTTIEGGTYNPVEGGSYVIMNSKGTLTINNATINACATYPIYSYNDGNRLVINDVIINATFGCVNAYGNGCEVEINGGTFQMTGVKGNTSHIAYFSQNAEVVINGGTFKKIGDLSMSATGGGGVCVNGGANLVVKGGSFSGDNDDVYNYGGVISVKGGTYKFEPDFLAEGYESVQNADGTWTVVKVQQDNEIWYVSDEMALEPTNSDAINAVVVSNVWDKTTGKGIITFDAPLTVIGENAFQRVTNTTPSNWATSITLPEGLETIGNYAFAQCYSLTNITIPDSVTSIGQYAFQSCDAVTNVTIGSGVTTIGSSAFYNCYEIKEIVCKATTPPALADKYVFYRVPNDIKVVVPADALNTYKEAEHWKSFTNIVAE